MQPSQSTAAFKPFLSDHDRPRMSRWKLVLIVGAAVAAVSAITAVVTVSLVFDSYYIPSLANTPTLQPGDRVLARTTNSPGRGDLVVYLRPNDAGEAVGRVVALEGDSVEAVRGRLVVNGVVIEEPYLEPEIATLNLPMVVVPSGHVFVLGDNRTNSADSRVLGPLPLESVSHRIGTRIWPPKRIGAV